MRKSRDYNFLSRTCCTGRAFEARSTFRYVHTGVHFIFRTIAISCWSRIEKYRIPDLHGRLCVCPECSRALGVRSLSRNGGFITQGLHHRSSRESARDDSADRSAICGATDLTILSNASRAGRAQRVRVKYNRARASRGLKISTLLLFAMEEEKSNIILNICARRVFSKFKRTWVFYFCTNDLLLGKKKQEKKQRYRE